MLSIFVNAALIFRINNMDKLKTILLKGKEYVEVSTRIVAFHENYEKGSIVTDVKYDGQYVRCKATVTPDTDNGAIYFTGHAEEDRTQGMVNKTNATENCETSAVGRTLAMMGIGIVDGVASADEVNHALHKQSTQQIQPSAPQKPTGALGNCNDCGAEKKMSQAGKPYCSKKCWLTPQNAPLPVIEQPREEWVAPVIDDEPPF